MSGIGSLFVPENLDMSCKTLSAAGDRDEGTAGRREATRQKIADSKQPLTNDRATP